MAERQFYFGVDVVIQSIKYLWPNLDVAFLKQALSQSTLQSLGTVCPKSAILASKPSQVTQSSPILDSPKTTSMALSPRPLSLSLSVHVTNESLT